MTKEEYKKYIDPEEFEKLYLEWQAAGKPKGNSKLYYQIWTDVENAVKACIGSLQNRYHCKYANYGDKVAEGVMYMIQKLQEMSDSPKNIVTMTYLPVLGICCGKRAKQQDFEDGMISSNYMTDGGDELQDIISDNDSISDDD